MRRGEIWWVRPPSPAGRKRRPMLVVSDDAFNASEHYPKVLVVHLTSVKRSGGPYDWEVPVGRGMSGLEKGSVVKCSEIFTLAKIQLTDRIGALPADVMASVGRALAVSLSLPLPD